MSEGMRDNFVENDTLGDASVGTVSLFGRSSGNSRKASRKHRTSAKKHIVRRSHRRKKTHAVSKRHAHRKPKFGTKAWMTYIRGMRGKKRKKK